MLARDARHCGDVPRREVPARFRPTLAEGPVTQRAAPDLASAARAVRSTPAGALPALDVTSTFATQPSEP
jgi:hypothetical protein